jgi:hypothetical protein
MTPGIHRKCAGANHRLVGPAGADVCVRQRSIIGTVERVDESRGSLLEKDGPASPVTDGSPADRRVIALVRSSDASSAAVTTPEVRADGFDLAAPCSGGTAVGVPCSMTRNVRPSSCRYPPRRIRRDETGGNREDPVADHILRPRHGDSRVGAPRQ